jgi:DNA-binding HxlR family transcriptional regulator
MGTNHQRERDTQSLSAALATIAEGWKPHIITHLLKTPLTLAELHQAIPEALPTALTQQLNQLVANDIVNADVNKTNVTVYRITKYGTTLTPVLEFLSLWGNYHSEHREHACQVDDHPLSS